MFFSSVSFFTSAFLSSTVILHFLILVSFLLHLHLCMLNLPVLLFPVALVSPHFSKFLVIYLMLFLIFVVVSVVLYQSSFLHFLQFFNLLCFSLLCTALQVFSQPLHLTIFPIGQTIRSIQAQYGEILGTQSYFCYRVPIHTLL